MSERIEYCTLEPVFPKKAFMLFLFILHQDNMIGTVPVDTVYTTPDMASEGIKETVAQFGITDREITVPEECLLIPIEFQSLFQLRKEFWGKPTLRYTSHVRMTTFAPVIEKPNFYSVLVTPSIYDDTTKNWQLNAALPLMNQKETVIERFMFTSDYIVEPRAKYAAIYSMENKLRFNWQTKEIKQFDNTINKLLQKNN